MARGRFNRLLVRKVDSEDVVQSAFYESVFVRLPVGKLAGGGWDGLWNLLTLITLRKRAELAENFLAGRRDAVQEATGLAIEDKPDAWLVTLDREPRPEEAVFLAATVEYLFRDVNAHERPILTLNLQAYTLPKISGGGMEAAESSGTSAGKSGRFG